MIKTKISIKCILIPILISILTICILCVVVFNFHSEIEAKNIEIESISKELQETQGELQSIKLKYDNRTNDSTSDNTTKILILNRSVNKSTTKSDALLIEATISYTGKTEIDFPIIEFSLMDLSGHTLKKYQFTPEQYLSNNPNKNKKMIPDQRYNIKVEAENSPKESEQFEINFL